MPKAYNSRACVRELKHRVQVVDAVRSGWKVADPFCLPMPIPSEVSGSSSAGFRKRAQKRKAASISVASSTGGPAGFSPRASADASGLASFPQAALVGFRLVARRQHRVEHLWHVGVKSICGRVHSGSPEHPARGVHFAPIGAAQGFFGRPACAACCSLCTSGNFG